MTDGITGRPHRSQDIPRKMLVTHSHSIKNVLDFRLHLSRGKISNLAPLVVCNASLNSSKDENLKRLLETV